MYLITKQTTPSFILALFFILLSFVAFSQQKNEWLNTSIHNPIGSISSDKLIKCIEDSLQINISYSNTVLNKTEQVNLKTTPCTVNVLLDKIFKTQALQFMAKDHKLFISINSNQIKTQNSKSIKIEGRIINQKTKEPIPFSTIRYKNISKGTIANENGCFKLLVPEKQQYDTLEISSLGYEIKYTTPAHFKNTSTLNYALKEQLVKLAEVTIKPPNPKAILDSALNNIAKKYPQNPHYLNAYYRELIKEDSSFIKFCDASCQLYYDGYFMQNNPDSRINSWEWQTSRYGNQYNINYSFLHAKPPYKTDQAKIIDCRASENHQKINNDTLHTEFHTHASICGGPIAITCMDATKSFPAFLNDKRYKNYQFKIKGKVIFRNKEAYHFSFSPKKNSRVEYQGEFYIDLESYAFISLKYYRLLNENPDKLKAEMTLITDFSKKQSQITNVKQVKRKIYETAHYVEVDYIPFDGLWYLNRIKHQNSLLNRGNVWKDIVFETSREIFVNSIDRTNVLSIPKKEALRASEHTALFDYPYEYNSEYWENYDAIVPTGVFGAALADLNVNKPLNQQFKDKVESNPNMPAPVALKKEHKSIVHHDTLIDHYQWMANENDIDVGLHLQAEEKYCNNYFLKVKKMQRDIYHEMVDRIEQTSQSIPVKKDSFYYYTEYNDTANYAFFYRKYDSINANAELILNENEMAKGYPYYAVKTIKVSPNQKQLAFIENTSGTFKNTLRFKNIEQNAFLQDSLSNVANMVWANDSTLYYTSMDSSYRSSTLYSYIIGNKTQSSSPLFHEMDSTFYLELYKSKDKKYVFINSASADESEIRFINTADAEPRLILLQKRQNNLLYDASVVNDTLYIISNKGNDYFSLYTTPIEKPQKKHWKTLIEYKNDEKRLKNFMVNEHFIALEEITNMHSQIKIIDKTNNSSHYIKAPKNYHALIIRNIFHNADTIEYTALSYNFPAKVFRYNIKTKEQRLVKSEKVLGDYKAKNYSTKQIYATTNDGIKIPITLTFNNKWKEKEFDKGKRVRSDRKLLIRGYGAYGIGNYPSFSSSDLALLNRGYTIAYAHVRGGDELGLQWYKQGKMLNKKNTFTDFKACMDELIKQGFGSKGEIIAEGGSAGGLLMGVLANNYPEYFKCLVLHVPFTDVLNTMLDEKLPLTTGEFKEWGNPKRKKYYDYIKSYDPYQNIKAQEYPSMLFITYVSDPNAPFYQAAKTVAKIREYKTDNNKQLLKCYKTGGHQGNSGRWEWLKNKAMVIAFIEYENKQKN